MLKPPLLHTLRSITLNTNACPQCQQKLLTTAVPYLRTAPFSTSSPLRADTPPPNNKPKEFTPKSRKAEEEFIPKPLGRPIGLPTPPQPGENSGLDPRTLHQKRKDLTSWQKHLERRDNLARRMSKPYFRDFTNVKYHKGKTFFANERVFKRDAALFFPNLHGGTLESGGQGRDTTDVLPGRVSVVNVFSSVWGENQVRSFTGRMENPVLEELVRSNGDVLQMVNVNVEENPIKAAILRLFQYRLRAQRDKSEWGKYFIVRRGIGDRIRESIGLLNGRVGYVYLVDKECRIRWAASGDAEDWEKESLMKAVRRLLDAARKPAEEKPAEQDKAEKVEEELEAQAVSAGAS